MNWSIVRKSFAAWVGATMGYTAAGTGVIVHMGSDGPLVKLVKEDASYGFIVVGVVLGLSAIHTTAVMFAYHEEDQERRQNQHVVLPRNYFRLGLTSAVTISVICASFAGAGSALIHLLSWLRGGP